MDISPPDFEKVQKTFPPVLMVALALSIFCPPAGLIVGIYSYFKINSNPNFKGKSIAVLSILASVLIMLLFANFVKYNIIAYKNIFSFSGSSQPFNSFPSSSFP